MSEITPIDDAEGMWDFPSTETYGWLSTLGKVSPWLLLSLTAVAFGGGVLARKKIKPLGQFAEASSGEASICPTIGWETFPNSSAEKLLYKDLPCSAKERQTIAKIVNTLDAYSALGIIPLISTLRAWEEEIVHLHPLRFLGTIFADPTLKQKVANVFQDRSKFFQQDGFIAGIAKGMRSRSIQQLRPYLEDWAESIGGKSSELEPLIQKKQWRELVFYCLQR